MGISDPIASSPPRSRSNILPVTLIVLLMVAGVAGLIAVSLRWNMRQEIKDLDNISVHSDLSIGSTTTTVEDQSEDATVDDKSGR